MPKKEKEEKTKGQSVITYKTDKPAENLYQALGKTEETIQELSRLFSECENSGHYGVKGQLKLTSKQAELKKQLDRAQERADKLMQLIASLSDA